MAHSIGNFILKKFKTEDFLIKVTNEEISHFLKKCPCALYKMYSLLRFPPVTFFENGWILFLTDHMVVKGR